MTASFRPVLLCWLLLTALTQAPWVRALLDPPPGSVFVGAFFWNDDIQNYLSYAQQAEEGRWLLANKLAPGEAPAAMISPEFWLVGRLSALLGRRVFLSFRLLGVAAALALLVALDRILRAAGLPDAHRLPALVLAATGGGLGGWLFLLSDFPVERCRDIASGLFPFAGLLSNPHWTTASALLLWSLLLLRRPGRRPLLLGLALANVLAFSRPYEPILLFAMLASGAWREPWLRRRALWLALALAPWAVYQVRLSLFEPSFAFLAGAAYPPLPWLDAALALGPALLLALLAGGLTSGPDAGLRRCLVTWALLAGLGLLWRRPGPTSQLLVGVGLPLLGLGALGLARWRPAVTWLAAAALSGGAAASLFIVLRPDPNWFAASERWGAALALRPQCSGSERVFAPPDIGLHALALTRCRAYVSHPVVPDYAERVARLREFYGATEPARRAALLDLACAAHVVLPGPAQPRPVEWLGPETEFTRSALVRVGARSLEIHSRPHDGWGHAR
jgi:hypothetical protein